MLTSSARPVLASPALARSFPRRRPDTQSPRTFRPRRLTRVRPANGVVVAASEGDNDVAPSSDVAPSDTTPKGVSPENLMAYEGNSVEPLSFDNRWGGSDDEDDAPSAASAARSAASGHGAVWDERSSHTHDKALKNSAVPREPETEKERETEKEEEKVYTESEIASIQIDAIKHAAVADAASARLDLEWETKKFAPTPRVEPVPTQVEPTTDSSESNDSTNKHATGTTLPPCAVPTDTNAKASLGRYKYDIDATQSGGEPLCVVESYDPVEVAKIGDTPGAQLGDLLPETVRKACSGNDCGFVNTVLMQGFDWNSSKMFDEYNNYVATTEETTEKDTSSGTETGKHMSYWRWLTSRVASIAKLGVTHVWLPPPSQSVSPEGYLPGRLFNLDLSSYGTKADLVTLTSELKKHGITSVCDIVINHRTAEEKGRDGVYNVFPDLDPTSNAPVHWDTWAITCDDPVYGGVGAPDSGENYGPAPDLDHTNPELRITLKRWMRWLVDDVGFGGFRFDFVRGYAPEYVLEYVRSTFPATTVRVEPTHAAKEGHTTTSSESAKPVPDPVLLNPKTATNNNPAFNVGEFWVDLYWEGTYLGYDQDGPRGKLVNWLDNTQGACALFDFPTKGILQRAVTHTEFWRLRDKANRPPGLLGWVPQRSVTFIDNHDTGSPQNHWPFPHDRLALGYAYILTHPGIPCIFGAHVWTMPSLCDSIALLLDIRRRNGIAADSSVKILLAESDIYVATVGHSLTIKLGPRFEMPETLVPPEPTWALCASGEDYAVWERVAHDRVWPDGSVVDARSEYKFAQGDETDPDIASAAAENVRRVFGIVNATDEDALEFDASSPVLIGGNLDESKNQPSIGSFFEPPGGLYVEPAASFDEDADEDVTGENPR